MGNNRKKKSLPNNAKNSLITTASSKPDEAAASSMSSESSTERIIRTADKVVSTTTTTTTTTNTATKNLHHTTARKVELLWEHDELDRNHSSSPETFRFSWNEILALFFMLLTFALCSIIVGVAAGVSISIHYYESPENIDQRRIATTNNLWDESGRVYTPTITSLDPTILTYAKNYYSVPEERVVHTDASTGMRIALNIVVESPSLSTDEHFASLSNGTQSVDQSGRHRGTEHLAPPISNWDNYDVWLQHPPKLCSDSKTMGYDSWTSLRGALNDVNRYSAQQSDRWILYFAALAASKTLVSSTYSSNRYTTTTTTSSNPSSYPQSHPPVFDDDSLYYVEQVVLTICPGTILKAGSHPLVIDTESVTLQCDGGCTIDGGDSHISFGSSAKNVVIRGITFQNSLRSSILLQQNGAETIFEDCTWVVRHIESDRRKRFILPGLNEIANVNSSSILNFYRCSTIPHKVSRLFSLIWWWPTTNG